MFAIRHRPSGMLLPPGPGHKNRGFTSVEPSADPPRFFGSIKSAESSLRWWLGGEIRVTHDYDDNGDHDETWYVIHKPNRIAADMDIVSVTLTCEEV